MASGVEAKPGIGSSVGRGNCGYIYNKSTNCYDLRSNGCSAGCGCSQQICGFTAQVMQVLDPFAVVLGTTTMFPCSGPQDEPNREAALLRAIERTMRFWRILTLVLSLAVMLLAGGLAYLLLRA